MPVGYYGDYQIRGFPLDLATGLEVNGMTIAGEQDVPLENKESRGISQGNRGVESGVASAGGLIDYVTKRPANIQAVDLATDHRGTAYGAIDLGHLFGGRKQVGARVNLAGERIVPYMNDTDGWRAMGAGAADWKLNPTTIFKGDFEYQHKTERDGSGYQLLGGTVLPDIDRIYRSTMVGDQPWGLPDTYDTFNTDARLDHTFSPSWLGFVAASLSHSLIQDNVIYAYGCYYEAECQGNGGTAPDYFFAPDGTYDIYDYRDPGELRIDAEAEAMVTGHIHTGAITQDVTAGGVFLRSVQQPASTWRLIRIRPTALCRMAPSTLTSARRISTRRTRRFHRPAIRTRLNPRWNPPARAAFGKIAINLRRDSGPHSPSAALNSSPAAATIRCATITTPRTPACDPSNWILRP